MAPFLDGLCAAQWTGMEVEIWCEPFAGGAGAGLSLLFDDAVGELWLVEQHRGLFSFWQTVITDGHRFADRVANTTPTMDLWEHCRELLADPEPVAVDDLAYATFVVNRCSRGGIVHPRSGVMGGRRQNGRTTIASRFSADALAARIAAVADLGNRICVQHGDGISHIAALDGTVGIEDEVFVFADPPYLADGPALYQHRFAMADHRRLAAALSGCAAPWMVTYDAHPQVFALYPDRPVLEYPVVHRANHRHDDTEFAVFADRTVVPGMPVTVIAPGHAHWVTANGTASLF